MSFEFGGVENGPGTCKIGSSKTTRSKGQESGRGGTSIKRVTTTG